MKIKYSVLFPVLFIIFSLLFSVIIFSYISKRNQVLSAREKDKHLLHEVNHEIGELKAMAAEMKNELSRNSLADVLRIYKNSESVLADLKKIIDELSDETKPGLTEMYDELFNRYETLGVSLKKGDREQGLVLLNDLLKKL